jgi:hypothetical protein
MRARLQLVGKCKLAKRVMERDEETDKKAEPKGGKPPPPRPWTQRTQPTLPLPFVRFVDTDGEGRPSIIYRFGFPSGPSELPKEVYDILRDLKHREAVDGGQFSTLLRFKRDRKHGRVWTLPNSPSGRATADILDARLLDLARQMEKPDEPGHYR